MKIYPELLHKLIEFRRELHQYPELSGNEEKTAYRLEKFLRDSNPDKVIKGIGGHSVAFIYDSGEDGPVVLFRADMDALPVVEELDIPHASSVNQLSHKCGHDGHMAIMAGLSFMINKNRPVKGKAVLLFQAEEETGTGAEKIIRHPSFGKIHPDMAFALHNLPGYEESGVIIKDKGFAAASTGMIIRLKGKPTHAGHPENGINPADAIASLIHFVNHGLEKKDFHDFFLATVIHIKLGEVAFGTAASEAVFMLTLRSVRNDDMDLLKTKIEKKAEKIAKNEKLSVRISYTEEFPATINDKGCVEIIKAAADEAELKVIYPEESFRWSEDFGHFSTVCRSALFGLGAGINIPQLHNENYDFPDKIIPAGIKIFYNIYRRLLVRKS